MSLESWQHCLPHLCGMNVYLFRRCVQACLMDSELNEMEHNNPQLSIAHINSTITQGFILGPASSYQNFNCQGGLHETLYSLSHCHSFHANVLACNILPL